MSHDPVGGGRVLADATHRPMLSFRELRDSIRGDVRVEGDADWNLARQAWNLAVDQHPAMVALPECAEDVVQIVQFARARGQRIAPQGAGHNAAPLGSLADTILLRTTRMGQLDVDGQNLKARAEAGVNWVEVIAAASKHGLAGLAGTSVNLGVVGYSLGGGIGWLARRYGSAAESLTAVELVIADGSIVRADAKNTSDLFWALRGGGGSFGVVTAIEFELFPVSRVYAGGMYWPIERASEILTTWTQWTNNVPDELTSMGRLLNLPSEANVTAGMGGRRLVGIEAAFLGKEEDGRRLLQPFLHLGPEVDTFADIPVTRLGKVHMDPLDPIPWASDGILLTEFPVEAAKALVAGVGFDQSSELVSVDVRHLGGALARASPDSAAFSLADGKFAVFVLGRAWDLARRFVVEAAAQRVVAGLSQWSAGRSYLNFTERSVDSTALFPAQTHDRLRAIKAKYDKDDMFRGNHPIPAR